METSRHRVRRDYAPLRISIAVRCSTEASSPYMQVYSAADNEYSPDRTVSPCGIMPVINANASDGSWATPVINPLLTNMQWLVNGVDISTLSEWSGKYSIDSGTTATRGTITISKNLLPEQRIALRFKAVFSDTRMGVNVPVETQDVILSTVDESLDSYKLDIGNTQNVIYNPFLDKLLDYDYEVAHGIITASETTRNQCIDGNCYLKTIPIYAYKGATKLTSTDYTIKLFSKSGSTETELNTSNDEVLEVSTSQIVLDIRLINSGDYVIRAYVGSTEFGSKQFSVSRVYDKFTCQPINEIPIKENQTTYVDEVNFQRQGQIVPYPENFIKIVWYTDSSTITSKMHNEGQKTNISLSETGIGSTSQTDWLDIYVTAEQKAAYKIATNESGDIYTDENDNSFIIN